MYREERIVKQCPICQAVAFDDAKTCFGCLHDFTANDAPAVKSKPEPDLNPEPAPEAPPAFVIQIKPERERSGLTSWTCTVDLVPA